MMERINEAPEPGAIAIEALESSYERYRRDIVGHLNYWNSATLAAEQNGQSLRAATARIFAAELGQVVAGYIARQRGSEISRIKGIEMRRRALNSLAASRLLQVCGHMDTIDVPGSPLQSEEGNFMIDVDPQATTFRVHATQELGRQIVSDIVDPNSSDIWLYGDGLYVNCLNPMRPTQRMQAHFARPENEGLQLSSRVITYEPFIETR
jgi:hypothetical protein